LSQSHLWALKLYAIHVKINLIAPFGIPYRAKAMKKTYLFIDESDHPNFFAKGKQALWERPEWDPLFMLGMVEVNERNAFRQGIVDFQTQIASDTLFAGISSICKPNWYLHASKDHPDVRLKFFEFLRHQKHVKAYVAIARKSPERFLERHNGRPENFYFDVLNNLLERYSFLPGQSYQLILSARQSNTIGRFETALQKALETQKVEHTKSLFNCRIAPSKDFPELSAIDYLLWALKRHITKGGEDSRYLFGMSDLYQEIFDIYGKEGKPMVYNKENSIKGLEW
jgi:hypothetical protein